MPFHSRLVQRQFGLGIRCFSRKIGDPEIWPIQVGFGSCGKGNIEVSSSAVLHKRLLNVKEVCILFLSCTEYLVAVIQLGVSPPSLQPLMSLELASIHIGCITVSFTKMDTSDSVKRCLVVEIRGSYMETSISPTVNWSVQLFKE